MSFLSRFEHIAPASLGVPQRILLATDGTITDALEALFLEPVGIVKLSSTVEAASEPLSSLDLDRGERVVHRRVLLRGAHTGRTFAYASTELAIDRLPAGLREGILTSDTPLGRLWQQHRLETLKELVSAARVRMGELAAHFPECASSDLLRRTYRLVAGGRPVMMITECFPVELPG
jgi:chorismate-pyruvate lyase